MYLWLVESLLSSVSELAQGTISCRPDLAGREIEKHELIQGQIPFGGNIIFLQEIHTDFLSITLKVF